ncbi:MAG: hypothetical protein NVSMB4_20290 [Acidimicrobiales bacterium]
MAAGRDMDTCLSVGARRAGVVEAPSMTSEKGASETNGPELSTGQNNRSWLNPAGWDASARRAHDLTVLPGGHLLHHSFCWCRREIS